MSFDRLAPHYRWMERLTAGDKLQRCRIAFLDTIPPPGNVLIYGEGNGRFLVELLRRFPTARVTVVDASAAMIRLARERTARAGLAGAHVTFVEADALTWKPPVDEFDLIVTCFFLDCFREDQLRRLVPVIAAAAEAGAHWIIADFQIAASGWRRLRSRMVVWLLYAFFRVATRLSAHKIIDPAPFLEAANFVRLHHVEQDHGMLCCGLWRREDGPA